jgi:glucuronoarabinoxylan endo-1,4-beta-xylanase
MKRLLLIVLMLIPFECAAQTATINGATTFQTIDGFGASTGFNERNNNMTAAQADCFFSTSNGSCPSGNSIGLSWIRIQDNDIASSAPDSPTVILAAARGAKVLLGFNNTSGPTCTTSPLAAGNCASLASYDVAKIQYWNTLGVTISAIGVLNEPENTSTTADNLNAFVANYLYPAMVTASLTSVQITMPESTGWFFTDLISACMANHNCGPHISTASGHLGYFGHGTEQFGFAGGYGGCCTDYTVVKPPSSVSGLHLWQTEINGGATGPCASDSTLATYDASMSPDAITWAYQWHSFLSLAGDVGPNGGSLWMMWNLAAETANGTPGCNDGLANQTFVPAKRFYAFGNWARFVRPGQKRISATPNPQTNVYVTAFKDPVSGQFEIVALNKSGSSVSQTFSLANLTTPTVTPWITSSSLSLQSQTPVTVSGNAFSYSLPASSVTTFVAPVPSNTINALSCSQSDVQAAFNLVTASTLVVNIPACPGGATWLPTATATLNIPSGSSTLTLQGQTSCTGSGNPALNNLACTDSTVIIDGSSGPSGGDPPILALNTTAGGKFRMTGMTFQGSGATQTFNGAITVNGGSTQVRVDHNDFKNLNQLTLSMGSGLQGVVDHNIMSQASPSIVARIVGSTSGDFGGNIPWSQPTNLGQANFMYFEDNKLVGGSNDCDRGGRFVFRYNTFLAQSGTAQFQLTHPTGEPGGAIRGCRAWEVYGNNFNANGLSIFSVWFLSAGTGTTWGNTVTGAVSNFFSFISERTNNTTYSQVATPNGWGYCGTAFNGTGSAWDQNSVTSTGYRCLDNPGTGQSDLLTPNGNFPSLSPIQWPHQASEPIYEWQDTYTPGNFVNNPHPTIIANNSDYYLWCNAASPTGCTSFDGTVGVGAGTLAARPSTCTPGTAYFATDQGDWNHSGIGGQGQLYKCVPGLPWTLFYTPYTYPHPLVSGGGVSLTVSTSGTGTGTISGLNCFSGSFSSGTPVGPCSAAPTVGTFAGWSSSGSASCSGTGTCPASGSFSLTSTSSITATFTAPASTCGNPFQSGPNYSGSGTGPGGAYYIPPPLSVGFTSPTSGCAMFYTSDGSAPTCSSTAYPSGGFSISTAQTITYRAIACQTGFTASGIVGGTWQTLSNAPPQLNPPTFSPPGGNFATLPNVAIIACAGGAISCTTTNGSTPTASPVGSCSNGSSASSITIPSSGTVLNALCTEAGFNNSSVANSGPYIMTPLEAQGHFDGGSSSLSSASCSAMTVSAGSCLTAEVAFRPQSGVTAALADNVNAGNYTPLIPLHSTATANVGSFMKPNAAAGATTVTMTLSGAGTFLGMSCQAWKPAGGGNCFQDNTISQQQDTAGTASANPFSGTTKTPVNSNTIVVGNLLTNTLAPSAAGTNYLFLDQLGDIPLFTEYWAQGARTATNTPFTMASDNWVDQQFGIYFALGAATPMFSPPTSPLPGGSTITLSTTSAGCGPYIWWQLASPPTTTTGTNATSFSLTSSGTYYAQVIGCPGVGNSAVASAVYIVSAFQPPTLVGNITITGAVTIQ